MGSSGRGRGQTPFMDQKLPFFIFWVFVLIVALRPGQKVPSVHHHMCSRKGVEQWILLILGASFISFATAQVSPANEDAILQILGSLSPLPPNWVPENISQVCTWTGISCVGKPAPYRQISSISLSEWGATLPSDVQISGTLPDVFGNLTDMKSFSCYIQNISGTIPPSIFTRSLSSLDLSSNNLTGTIPMTIANATSLSGLDLRRNFLSGTLPDVLTKLPLTWLQLVSNYFECPLPAGLVQYMSRPGVIGCGLGMNNFMTPDQPGICGNSTFLGGERCKFLPSRLLHATNKITREPDFAFRDNGLDVRVFGNTVYFYRILRSGEISDEYLVVDFQGVGETTTNVITGFPDETTHFRQSIIYGFDDLQKDPNKPLYYLTIKTAKPFHAKGVIIMLLDPDVVPYGTLKFSANFSEWQFNSTAHYFAFYTTLTLRSVHAVNHPLKCKLDVNMAELNFNAECLGDEGTHINGVGTISSLSMSARSPSLDINFEYPLIGYADGQTSFLSQSTYINFMYGDSPLAPDDVQASHSTQAVVFGLELNGASFTREFYYDPTFTLEALFDPEPDGNNSLAIGLGVGISAAVVLLAVALIVFVKPLRQRVIPFRDRSAPNGSCGTAKNSWVASTKPE